jgi:thiamine-phosphate pyrophosphorylase
VGEAVRAGLRFVQVRERDLAEPEFRDLLDALASELPPGVTLAVNGRPVLAARRGLGLHLGAAEPSPGAATRRAIPLLGRSAHDTAEARRALDDAPDYIICGTIYETDSKPERQGGGTELLGEVRHALQEGAGGAQVPLLYAIGGITAAHAAEVLAAGAYGLAVTAAILGAEDPAAATRDLLEAIARAATQ